MLRAFYEWMVDNDLTPHLVVSADLPGVKVPIEFVQDGQIILNVTPRAVGNLELGNDAVMFNARFSGRPHSIIVPIYAVQAIYARENGAGTMFEPEDAYEQGEIEGLENLNNPISIASEAEEDPDDQDPDDEPPRPRGKPSLRVVK
jgi:stringent starvation protein B